MVWSPSSRMQRRRTTRTCMLPVHIRVEDSTSKAISLIRLERVNRHELWSPKVGFVLLRFRMFPGEIIPPSFVLYSSQDACGQSGFKGSGQLGRGYSLLLSHGHLR